ncbi:beta-mannosidase [Streptomyces cyaneochromogenes]|uniref:Endoglucanase n=1 Tax=Streptomyces cyaneochromogenes TaxID=2496836 RepID=A0A3S9MJN7_9ACTN|nr:cellulase family glycosylhydrolase [Streptomyces cyaneochromogenes]AZQ39351.1 beta-mannosidase [Streptomyces cyaneochromogenes]
MRPRTRTAPPVAAVLAALLGLLAPLLSFAPPAQAAATGIHISNGRLLEGNGNDFVMRGVNHAHTWYPNQTRSLADIKALGANTVRVVLADGHRWTANSASDVANVISQCKANRLICVLEVHDTTGYGEEAAAGTLDQAADYWIGLKSVLEGQENYVVINIGNEPWGNTNPVGWTDPTIAAIKKLRSAGFAHTIMVDAPNWGQDWQGVMRDNARSVYAADPTGNLIFSIHMYSVYDTAQEITGYLNTFVNAQLPILIGEFGGPPDQYGDPDEDTMMAAAQQLRLGYLAWSWSGNTDPILDLAVNFNADQLSSWGRRIFNGVNGIAATSKEATVYSSGGGDTTPPTAPGTPTASEVTSSSAKLTWVAATDATGVTGYDVVRVHGTGEAATVSTTAASATVTGLAPSTSYTFAVYARDAAGNRSPRSATVTVTTASGGSSANCGVGYRVTNEWPGGFQGEIALRNTGSSAINGWTLRWTFPDSQRISNLWGGTATQSGAEVSVASVSYTASIAPAGSVTLGFTATKGSTNPGPTAFTVNGSACSSN